MKTKFSKKVLAFVLVLALAVPMFVFTANAEGEGTWNLVTDASELAAGDQVIIVAKGYTNAMSTTQGSNNRGVAAVTKSGDESTVTFTSSVQVLTLEAGTTDGTFAFNTGNGYLYCASTSSKNYLRTQATKNAAASWKISISDGTATVVSQISGISRNTLYYNNSNKIFACYGSAQQAIAIYKFKVLEVPSTVDTEALNAVNAYMSLGYKYSTSAATASSSVTDTLNRSTTGLTDTSYATWNNKTVNSAAVYAGQSAGGNSSIQLRSNNSNSGIITTASGGKVSKITVTWNSGTSDGRTLQVYGKDTAYGNPTELYNVSTQGDLLGTIVCGTSTTLEITDEYAYIGLRSESGAMYIDSIDITWTGGSGEVYEDSQFAIRCAVDASLKDVSGIDSYGIKVTAGANVVEYTAANASWTEEDGVFYVVINLGDIITNLDRLSTEFTVEAFVKVGSTTFTSSSEKTYSVVSMVEKYHDEGITEVEHLYKYLVSKGLI